MTTTTLSALAPATACMSHGLVDGERDCPRCGRRTYALDDDGDRATLKAYRKAALKSRTRTFALFGAVAGSVAQSALVFAAVGVLDVFLLSPGTACGVVVGALVARVARPLSQHRLDARLES